MLDDGSFPGDRHREQERVEAGIIESFSDVAPGCDHQPRAVVWKVCELPQCGASCFRLDAAVEDDEVRDILTKRAGEALEMITTFGQDDCGASFAHQFARVGDGKPQSVAVGCEDAVDLLNRRFGR